MPTSTEEQRRDASPVVGVLPPDSQHRSMTTSAAQTRSFLKHAAVYGFGSVLMYAAGIVLLPLYTRYLRPAEFGTLEILNRIGEMFNICLMVNGIRSAALTFYCQSKTPQQRQAAVVTLNLFLMVILVVAGVLVAVFAPLLGRLIELDRPTLLTFGVVTALLDATTVVPLALMQARVESLRFVCVSLSIFLFRVTLTIIAVTALGWGVWGILAASAVTSALFGGSLTVWELRRGSLRSDLTTLGEVVRYTLPFVPAGLCMFLLHNADRFFLLRRIGVDGMGVYALGYKLAYAVGMVSVYPLLQVWRASMYPAFELPNASVVVGRFVTWMLAAYLFVGLGLCLLQEEVLLVFGSPRYGKATQVIGLIVLAHFFFTAQNLMDSAFYVFRRTGLKPWLNLAAAIVTTALLAVLVRPFAAEGAAWALVGGLFFYALLTFVVSQRVFHVRYEFSRLACMLLAAIGLVLVGQRLGSDPLGVLGKLTLWVAWPLVLCATGVVTEEERLQARDVACSALSWLKRSFAGRVSQSDGQVDL